MKVATFPDSWRSNPFLDLLESHLAALGVEFQKAGSDYLTVRWLLRQRKNVDVLHFHWLQYHYLRGNRLVSWLTLFKFLFKVRLAKLCGYRIVWTMHNLLPHEQAYGLLDRFCYSNMAHWSNSIVTLCNKASLLLEQTYGRKKNVFSSHLGHYSDIYPNNIDPVEARRKLALSAGQKVFLFLAAFALIRESKN